MDLRLAACTLLETKVSLASLGQPAGVCGSPSELCVELTLSVEMAGRHKGVDVAMDVPRHPVPSDSSPTERTREGNVLWTLKQTGLPLLCRICSKLPLLPLGGVATPPTEVSGVKESLPPCSVALEGT